MQFKDFEEKTIHRQMIFEGKIIQVAVDDVALPQNLGKATRELVFHPGGVCIVPLTEDDKIVLVRQFRKPLEKVLLEIPAGKIEPFETQDLENAARRELEEETGYAAGFFEKLTEVYLSPGFCNELLHIYLAKDLQKIPNPRPQDADEVLELFELTLLEAKEKIATGEICDAKTVLAIWYWEMQHLKETQRKG